MRLIRKPSYDFNDRPFLVIWEATRACDLACKHCRAEAGPDHHPDALTAEEARHLIDQIDAIGHPRPLFIITGGDPFKRADLYDLVRYAAETGLPVAVSPSGTPLLTEANLGRLKEAGARAISLSLDGSTAAIHDGFRQVQGSYDLTIAGWRAARRLGLKVQINSTVTRANLADLPALLALVAHEQAMTWSVFFLVPTGRAQAQDQIEPEDCEAVLHFLYDAAKHIAIKTTEGHHYKRVVLQRAALEERGLAPESVLPLNRTYADLAAALSANAGGANAEPEARMRRSPLNVNAGDGFVFISHTGDVCPSGYLPLPAGNVRGDRLLDLYRDSPLFRALRHRERLGGRCGRCEFRAACGGSRSRAYATSGDYLAEDPLCSYEPGSFPFPVRLTDEEAT